MYRFTIKRTQLAGMCAYRTLLIANECSFSYLHYFYLLGCIVERERKRNKYETIYLSHMLLFCVSLHIFIVIKYHFANSSNWILMIFLEWNENRSLTSLQIWKWLVHFSHWIYKWYENKKFTHRSKQHETANGFVASLSDFIWIFHNINGLWFVELFPRNDANHFQHFW